MERYAGGRGSADGSAAAHDAVVRGHRDLGERRTMSAERSGEELVRRCQRNPPWRGTENSCCVSRCARACVMFFNIFGLAWTDLDSFRCVRCIRHFGSLECFQNVVEIFSFGKILYTFNAH